MTTQGTVVFTTWGASSDIGPIRAINEDAWVCAPPLFAVADGMGGHSGGDRASSTALKVVREDLGAGLPGAVPTFEELDQALGRAAHAVSDLAVGADPFRSPGTTLCGAVCVNDNSQPHLMIFNVGDSRAYLISGGEIRQITTDHSARQEALDREKATGIREVPLPPPNVVTRALGACMPGMPQFDYFHVPVFPGDHLLISTDGVHGVIPEGQIAEFVARGPDPQTIANELVRYALVRGTRDNATAVVVRVEGVSGFVVQSVPPVHLRDIPQVTPLPTNTAPRMI